MQPNSNAELAFHLGNMLSAGVMLSAGFCHLLADSLRQLSFIGRFPIATFLAATGYILTLLADQIVQMVMEREGGAGSGCGKAGAGGEYSALCHASPPLQSPEHPSSPIAGVGQRSGGGASPLRRAVPECCNGASSGSGGGCCAEGEDGMHDVSLISGGGGGEVALTPINCSPQRHSGKPHALSVDGLSPRLPRGAGSPAMGAARKQQHGGHGVCHPQTIQRQQSHIHDNPFEHVLDLEMSVGAHNHFQVFLSNRRLSFATALLLAGALCIHSILEGMALGAQPTLRGTEDIFLAIVAHKGLAAYALGASIVESRASDAKFWTTISLFSFATPVGIMLGYLFAAHSGGVGAAVSALAAGTFIYVALMEVVPKELENGRHRGPKMAAMLVGFGLMSLLAVWA